MTSRLKSKAKNALILAEIRVLKEALISLFSTRTHSGSRMRQLEFNFSE